MRVLQLFPSLDPAGGGIQSGGMSMVLASRRAGVEHVVACTDNDAAAARSQLLVDELERAGVEVVRFPQLRRPAVLAERWSASPAQLPWIWRAVRRFDVVHVHGAWNMAALGGLWAGRARGVPVVVTAHGSFTQDDMDASRSLPRRAQKELLLRMYLRWSSLFVLTSQVETRTSLPPDAPEQTIPYALYDRGMTLPALTPRGTNPELRLGFLGRIATRKNLPLLVEALALVPEHVRLVVAGDGDPELVGATKRRAAELGVAERIEWLGFVPPDRRDAFLASIDVLAMPSNFESFGMVAAEGMLAGVPMLVAADTGVREIVDRQGGGVVIQPDPASIAAAVRELDADRERLATLGAEGRRAIQAEMDYDELGRRLRAAYESVADAA